MLSITGSFVYITTPIYILQPQPRYFSFHLFSPPFFLVTQPFPFTFRHTSAIYIYKLSNVLSFSTTYREVIWFGTNLFQIFYRLLFVAELSKMQVEK